MNLIRKNVDKGLTEFKFTNEGISFNIKNLTSNKIYACLGDTYIESISVIILPNTSEILSIDENIENSVKTIQIYAEGSGEVEIQCLSYSTLLLDIYKNLDIIKNSIYGKEMRTAIHDSIKTINNKENDLEKILNALIKNATSSSPSDLEIVQARGNFDTLKDRLNDTDKNIEQNEKSLNEFQENLDILNEEIILKDLIKDQMIKEFTVAENEDTFSLPDNYQENSCIEVFINEEIIEDFTIQEVAMINCIVLNNGVKNSTVKIICTNFKKCFENYIKKIIENNTAIG